MPWASGDKILRRRLLYALLTLVAVVSIAVTGYRVLGGPHVGLLQALYMAVITLAGVGYGEIVDTSHSPALRIFNMFVVLVGVTLTVYVFSVVTAFLVEGEIRNIFWRRRMERRISELKDHYIVCGLGDTGRYCIDELSKTETPFVAVESQPDNVKKFQEHAAKNDFLYVVGDAADAATLDEAGIGHARGLIAALPSDKDNLVVTVMARQQNPALRIVARCTDMRFSERLIKAGANSTVSPNHIGGLRMASEALRPHVVGFLDLMLKEHSRTLRVDEIAVPEGGAWVGLSMTDIDLRHRYHLLPMAVKTIGEDKQPKILFDPTDNYQLNVGDVLVVMGDIHEVHKAQADAAHKRISSLTAAR
ncbi:MAG TPA: potassium channel protein [Terriglobales bacterium]|nr:potassium channel protein [Terriglobales bacterium]